MTKFSLGIPYKNVSGERLITKGMSEIDVRRMVLWGTNNTHSKKKCCIVSVAWPQRHVGLSMQFLLKRSALRLLNPTRIWAIQICIGLDPVWCEKRSISLSDGALNCLHIKRLKAVLFTFCRVSSSNIFHDVIVEGKKDCLNVSVLHWNCWINCLFVCLVVRVFCVEGNISIRYAGAVLCTIWWNNTSLWIRRRSHNFVQPVSLYRDVCDVYLLAPVMIWAA